MSRLSSVIMNDKNFKKQYIKSKRRLRDWRENFIAENGRDPTKVDIKASPVREYYNLYWKLKVQLLEAQILGEESQTECSTLSRTKSDSVLKEYTNKFETSKKIEEKKDEVQSTSKENVDSDTWGSHLNRTKTLPLIEKEKCSFINDRIAGKLFEGSSFKKRNPRKSLSFSKKKSSNKSLISDDGRSLGSPDTSSLMSPYSDCLSQEVDPGESFSVENDCSPNIKALISSSTSLSPLLSKSEQCKVLEEKAAVTVQPVSLVRAIASDPSVAMKPVRTLDADWVERCTRVETRNSNSDSGFESMELDPESKVDGKDDDESSDDDIIAGSDNELEEKSGLGSSFVSQKRKSECSPIQTIPLEEGHPSKRMKVDHPSTIVTKTKEEVKKEILEKKVKSGTLNENFVRINLKKKVFVRGKRNFNFAKYKKQEWKNKKKNLNDGMESGGVVRCYKCGESGHFGRYCKKQAEDTLLAVDDEEEVDELPTLEEAKKMAEEKRVKRRNVLTFVQPQESPPLPKVKPLYLPNKDGSPIGTTEEVLEALGKFGHTEFRPGQEETIMRILSGQSTLLTIATGGGKSLCYQLPAYLYSNRSKCITLVVSPLVSLMEDQVAGSCTFFKVGCLHTSQTQKQRDVVVEDAKNGKLYALLVSPEAVVSGDSGFGSIFKQLPPIAFACIDEVHCVSQWSHNFRPSYMMITKVLKEKLGVATILGLTATATASTIDSITRELGISGGKGVIKDIPLPDNLCLSVSRDEHKDEALLNLLRSARFRAANAILIYCTRRDECERLAVLIRTALQEPALREGRSSKSVSWNAESYHAGMAAGRRRQVQKAFMRGNLRIVVATVAFGMGINKQDIRAVIHYNMPKDFESYVQEVGRAGRDGKLAFCHLFLDSRGRDLNELRRHVHANSVDRHVLRKLLQRVFSECECGAGERRCEGHEVAFECSETIQALDIPEENIYTLLCYLELHEKKFIKVLSPVYMNCKIKSYRGMKEIVSAAKRCPPLAYACATALKKEKSEVLEFNLMEVANKLSWDSAVVKSQLKNIEWDVTPEGKWKKTGIAVEFSGLGFRVCSKGDMTPSELDEALDYLIQRVESQEKRSVAQLEVAFSTFYHFAEESYAASGAEFDENRSRKLKEAIREYFEQEVLPSGVPAKQLQVEEFDEEALAGDVRTLICTYRDNTFNGRAVARIFHGIQSPNYPASLWFKCRYWRKHLDKDFNKISRIATREILRLKL